MGCVGRRRHDFLHVAHGGERDPRELAAFVVAPTCHFSRVQVGTRDLVSGGDRLGFARERDTYGNGRRGQGTGRCAKLAVSVASPTHDIAVHEHCTRVRAAGRNGNGLKAGWATVGLCGIRDQLSVGRGIHSGKDRGVPARRRGCGIRRGSWVVADARRCRKDHCQDGGESNSHLERVARGGVWDEWIEVGPIAHARTPPRLKIGQVGDSSTCHESPTAGPGPWTVALGAWCVDPGAGPSIRC